MAVLHQFVREDFEAAAHKLRIDILTLCQERNLDQATVAAALADTLATMVAVFDKRAGQRTLNDKLDSFCARVEETYERLREAGHSASGRNTEGKGHAEHPLTNRYQGPALHPGQ